MDIKEAINNLEESPGYFKHNNFHFVDGKSGESVEIRADLNENSLNPYGIAHGGIIFGLGDMAMGMLASSKGKNAVTLSANINYLRPAIGKYLIAKAEIIKDGKSTSFLRCNIYNDKEDLVSTMDANYFYIET